MLRINADRFRAARKAAGFTQAQLGEVAGITEAAIRSYENHTYHRNPKPQTLKPIAQALNVEPETLYDYGIITPAALTIALVEAEQNGLGKLITTENGLIFASGWDN